MSLVNDMLRDLDKRRKESSGNAGSVSLTPASEILPQEGKRPITIYLIVALVLGAGAIAWFWLQQDGSDSTRELNIAPRVAIEPAVLETGIDLSSTKAGIVDQQTGSDVLDDSVQNESQLDIARSQPNLDANSSRLSNSVQAEFVQSTGRSQDSALVALTDEQIETAGADKAPAVDSRSVSLNEESNTGQALDQISETNEGEPRQTADTQSSVDLNVRPAEEVKNAAALSPEEQDVRAVQKALQQIAENKTTEAYATLEQEIVGNRYAHQTRETYAKLLLNEGNHLGSFELIEAGLALSPNHRGFKKVKARLLIAQGMLDDAVNLLLTRAPPVDADLEYHEILATAQLASRDYEGALISYTGLVRQDQNQGRWWYGFAASQDSLGNTNAARQGYARAVNLSNLSANLRRRSQERLAVLSQ